MKMIILVTVGTHYKGFNRLLKEVDKAIKVISTTWEQRPYIIVQKGSSSYIPRYADLCFEYVDNDTFQRIINLSDYIISHAGVGTILYALYLNKPLALMPRLKKYGEVIDDHQLEIAYLAKQIGIEVVNSYKDIVNFLQKYKYKRPKYMLRTSVYKVLNKIILNMLGVK